MIFKLFKFRIIAREAPGFPFKEYVLKELHFKEGNVLMAIFDVDGVLTEAPVDWDRVFLLQYAGAFDKAGVEIYHGDILKDEEGEFVEVLSIAGGFGILDKEQNPVFLTDDVARKLTRVANVIEDGTIGQPKPEDLEKAFVPAPKRVVRLKKK